MAEKKNLQTMNNELSCNESKITTENNMNTETEIYNTVSENCDEVFQNQNEDEKKISVILQQLRIEPMHSGYRYLIFSILLYKDDPYYRENLTKRLYPAVAERFGKSSSAVASAIGRSVKKGINKCDSDIFRHYFGYTYNKNIDKITGGELIALVAEKIRFD